MDRHGSDHGCLRDRLQMKSESDNTTFGERRQVVEPYLNIDGDVQFSLTGDNVVDVGVEQQEDDDERVNEVDDLAANRRSVVVLSVERSPADLAEAEQKLEQQQCGCKTCAGLTYKAEQDVVESQDLVLASLERLGCCDVREAVVLDIVDLNLDAVEHVTSFVEVGLEKGKRVDQGL